MNESKAVLELITQNAGAYYEAQQSVIGSVLIDSRALPEAMGTLREEDFSVPELRTLFRVCRDLWMERRPVDPVTVLDAAGSAYRDLIRQIMQLTPTAANVAAYARSVVEEAQYLRIRQAAEAILDTRTLAEALPLLAEAESLAAGNRQLREVSIQDALVSAYIRAGEKVDSWISWGIPKLDEVLRLPRGKFVVLAADSSVGKTALALQLAWNAARRRKVVFYSIETDDETLADRVVAQRVQIPLSKLQDREVSAEQFSVWTAVGQVAQHVDLTLVDASAMSLQQIRAHLLTSGAEVAFIDYVQMLDAPGREIADKVRAVSLALHKMCQDLRVTIVGLSQLTVPADAPNKWVPKLENLRESRQLKNDADAVLLLYLHKRSERDGGRWLAVAKNKEGRVGRLYLRFDGEHMWFTEAPAPAEREPEAKPSPLRDTDEATPFDQEALPL